MILQLFFFADFMITELQSAKMIASKNPALLKSTTPTTPAEVADQVSF